MNMGKRGVGSAKVDNFFKVGKRLYPPKVDNFLFFYPSVTPLCHYTYQGFLSLKLTFDHKKVRIFSN